MAPRTTLIIRLAALVLGQVLYGFAIALVVRAHVGVEPWDAFALGVAARTGLRFGLLTNVIGALVLLLGGAALLAVATGMYISAGFGPGPRDGLMTGLHSRFGMPIWLARLAVEGSVAAAGWALGGDIGVGTVAFALLIGPLCARTLPWFTARMPSPAPRVGSAHPSGS